METRNKTEFKIYLLYLNMMKDRAESSQCVAIADDPQKIIDWYNSLLTKPYSDIVEEWTGPKPYQKIFRKDSPLEWFNPIGSFTPDHFGHGIREQWVDAEELRYLQCNNLCFFTTDANDQTNE